jgi:glycosyltransferase involved in cell wall biosynthesis
VSAPPGVHQVAAGAVPRDAITHHMLEAQDVLRAQGLRSEIFVEAGHIAPGLGGRVHPVKDWDRTAAPRDGAILHYSIASPAFFHVLERCGRCAIHYHNITPAELLWRFAPAIALDCAVGRRRLAELAGRVGPVGADSAYNAAELEELGFGPGTVLGIMRQPLPAAPRRPRREGAPARLLFVGRGVPNKAQHHLVLTSAALADAGVDHELNLVGAWTAVPAYTDFCQALAEDLGVADRVRFVGSVTDAELALQYAEADLFLCLSDHEGFCVPLLEAMACDLPIVAYASSAVPETLGEAGLLLDDKTPSLVAEAVAEVLGNPLLAARMAQARSSQLRRFDHDAVAARLLAFAEEMA